MKKSTSQRRGIDGIAPQRVIQINAALLPNSIALRQLLLNCSVFDQSTSECLTAKAPVKQSPAPTVSKILKSWRMFLLMLVTTSPRTSKSLVITAEPRLPNFSNTFKLGCFLINFSRISIATCSKSNSPSFISIVGSILKSSVSFGEMQVILLSNSSGILSSLPPQSSMTILPFEWAYFAAATFTVMGISFCNNRQSDSSTTFLNYSAKSRLSSFAKWMFAPPYMTIELSPVVLSTQMQALPVFSCYKTLHLSWTLAASISSLRDFI